MAGRVFRHAFGGAFKGVRGTAVAAAAMAALTASQAPGAVAARASEPVRPDAPAEHGPSVSGDTPYRTQLPPLRAGKPDQGGRSATGGAGALPATVFAAYRHAEAELARTAPGCHLRWQLLAAIGQVESGQAWGGRVRADGTTVTPILGPRLTGGPYAVVRDTDGGAYDGDPVYDRAVGPMQFIPSTWAHWGADGNGDGRDDPDNVFDAALAAGRYLCAGGRDLSDPAQLDRAVLGYNASQEYLRTVRAWYAYFLAGHRVVPDLPGGAAASQGPKPPRQGGAAHPSPKPSGHHPGATPSPAPSATVSAPSPTPSPSLTAGVPQQTDAPPSLPVPTIGLPGTGVLPSGGPLTSNSADTMGSTPSPTADTGR